MRVEPITCYRPRPELASEFVAPPYDVFDHEGARSYVKEHPRSFLAVDRPETAFPPEHDPCADDVYEKAHELLAARAADGTLRISEIAGGSAEELLTDVVIASYSLTISATSEGVETITVEYLLPDNTTGTLTIVDRTYLTIGNKTYSHSDLAAVTGRYYAANGDSLELTERGGLSVNGTSVTVLRLDNDVAGQITVTYRYRGVEQTAVFTAGGATVGETVYTKVTFTPARFVGTYLVGENTVTVSASMGAERLRMVLCGKPL